MRNAFADELTQIALKDPRVVMLSGDIGNKLFDKFKGAAPERFFNCGVAEANIIGMAAGMAMNGLKPIAYTITPFITYRCFEQIRVDLCYHNVPGIIVGVGSGLSYTSLGATHHSCEDIAVLRSLPNMTVIAPADPVETREALRAAIAHNGGPVYIRMGKKGEPVIHPSPINFKIGKAIELSQGKDIALLGTGTILPEVIATGKALAAKGISATVASVHTIKPLDTEYLKKVFANYKLVVTIEEHSTIGGFGSAVAEWCVTSKTSSLKLLSIGTPDEFFHEAGEQENAREKFGLSTEQLVERIEKALKS